MRLLPVRPDHGRRGAAQGEAEADRPGHQRGDDQHLSLRHLSAHPHRDPRRRRQRQGVGRPAMKLNRRHFIASSAVAGGGLALGWTIPGGVLKAIAQKVIGDAGSEVGIWVVIHPDDTTTVRIARSEMGQGTLTGLAQLVAEDLECDWSKVKAEYVAPEE